MTHGAADYIIARITGEAWMGKDTSAQAYPTQEDIAQRAYQLYEARRRVKGHDLDDWLVAERELTDRRHGRWLEPPVGLA